MGRRTSKAEGAPLLLAILIGLPAYAAARLFETIGWVIPLVVVCAFVVLVAWYKQFQRQKRLAYLRDKYRDEQVVQDIYAGYFWQGQTEEQLRDAIGPPAAIDNKLLKTMTREVWKYHPTGVNRYRLRITVEDGRVAGWDKKS
jgi:hypothetical protein